MDKQTFIDEAIEIADSNMRNLMGGPFGAVVVKNGIIIAKAANTVTTSNDPTAHAEVNAIRLACKNLETFDLSGCEIYCSCEPCPMCLASIYWARIEKIYFSGTRFDAQKAGFDDSFIYEEFRRDGSERKIHSLQLFPEKGKTVLEQWKNLADKTAY